MRPHNILLFSSESVAASGSATSAVTDLKRFRDFNGNFAIQYAISGSGTVKFEYESSIDGTNYIQPTGSADIATGLSASSGPGSDGKDIADFTVAEACRYIRVKVTETGTSDAATVTAYMCIS